MAQATFSSVDEYLAAQPPAAQRILRRVRTVIRKALPAAEETLSYKIPSYKVSGGTALHFAGWKDHFSLYPASEGVVRALAKELRTYEVQKGTIRFPYAGTLPVHLISRIAQLRAEEVAGDKTKAKAPAKAKRGKAAAKAAKPAKPAKAKPTTKQPAKRAKPAVAKAKAKPTKPALKKSR